MGFIRIIPQLGRAFTPWLVTENGAVNLHKIIAVSIDRDKASLVFQSNVGLGSSQFAIPFDTTEEATTALKQIQSSLNNVGLFDAVMPLKDGTEH